MKKFKKLLVTLGAFGGLAVAGTVANADQVYTVKSGDTLSEIATNFNTTVDTLAQANSIANVNVISVGQQLDIPTENTQNNVQPQANQVSQQSVAQQSVVQPIQQQATTQQTNTQVAQSQTQATTSNQGGSNLGSAAEQIAQAESGGDYNARNGQYVGRYQLSASYLNGDYSPANQDRVFLQYCNQRYGSVENALAFRQSHGWY